MRLKLPEVVIDALIERAQRSPYHKGHLYHADDSLYMGRYTLFETYNLSARVHHIATPDLDHHFHDHPWPFSSVVLRGWYVERLPGSVVPCFHDNPSGGEPEEISYVVKRPAGSVAFRRACSRHLICEVAPDTWSLFFYGRPQQDWGFYTPTGKIHWRDYIERSASPWSKLNNNRQGLK